MTPVLCRAVLLTCAIAMMPSPGTAATLQPSTAQAYEAYARQAQQAFMSRDRGQLPALTLCDGVRPARAGGDDGIFHVPDGLVHHWRGTAFIRDATMAAVVKTSRAYGDYRTIYREVVASQLISDERDLYRIQMRIKEGEAGVSAVLDVRSTVQYSYPAPGRVFAVSNAEEIREVKNAGERDERLLPAGNDSGYLWRAGTFSHFLERPEGVYIEMETLGLSRRFPSLLGWMIEPIARRLGRRSIERSLQQFLAAVRTAARLPPGQACG